MNTHMRRRTHKQAQMHTLIKIHTHLRHKHTHTRTESCTLTYDFIVKVTVQGYTIYFTYLERKIQLHLIKGWIMQ